METDKTTTNQDIKNFNDPLQEDIFFFNQSTLSSDEHVFRYKRIIYGSIMLVLISGILGLGYYLLKSDLVVSPVGINSGDNQSGYDSVMYVPKDADLEDLISGRIRPYSNSASSYTHILVSESGDGKVIQYYLMSDNIDLSLSEGYPVELHGKFIEADSAFNVKSIKLK